MSGLLEVLNMRIKDAETVKAALEKLLPLLVGTDLEPSGAQFSTYIDFDNLTREQVETALRVLHAGKWVKSPGSTPTAITYAATDYFPGITVRLFNAAPPPSCKLVEEEVLIEAVPAHTEKRLKLVCLDADELEGKAAL